MPHLRGSSGVGRESEGSGSLAPARPGGGLIVPVDRVWGSPALGERPGSLGNISSMKILKSSRHSKITGDFAEGLVLYWLSKYGFECARVDHSGIDLIARNPYTPEVMGIAVKSRSRNTGTEKESLSIPNENFDKARKACDAFRCTPYFAIVVDAADAIRVYLMTMDHLLQIAPKRERLSHWKMTPAAIRQYQADEAIKCFEFQTKTCRWWS